MKLFRYQQYSNRDETFFIHRDYVLGNDLDQARSLIDKKLKLFGNFSNIDIKEVDFEVAYISTYFEKLSGDKKLIHHVCSHCRRPCTDNTHVGSFCKLCGRYLAYEELNLDEL